MGEEAVVSNMPHSEAYNVDLAYVHDTGFGDFARNAAPGLLKILEESRGRAPHMHSSKLIVDLGCGSGIWTRTLVDSGYQVLGVDLSSAMIELARQRVPQGSFLVASFIDAALPDCHAVTALGEVFNYLFDAQHSLSALRGMFQRVFDALEPGGTFIFDVAEPGRCHGRDRTFMEGHDWACLVEYLHNEAAQQLTRRIITFRKIGETYRRHEETHRQQLYERAALVEMLSSVGFRVETLSGYGTDAFPTGVVGFVARKV
jgi:SAM-dependent methyltransferase